MSRDAGPGTGREPAGIDVAGNPGDIQVITRAAQLLRLFDGNQRSIRVAEASAELGLQRTTTHRYLTSLTNAGFLERDRDGSYVLGPLLVQLGTVALRGLRVLEVSGPYLQQLADDADHSAVLAVWGGLGPVVARMHEPVDRLVNISVRVGSALPLEAAQSQIFLAFMQDPAVEQRLLAQLPDGPRRELREQLATVRAEGYAFSAQVVQGISALAAPVFDGHGQICATVAVLGTVSSIPEPGHTGILLALLQTVERLSRVLGWAGPLPFAYHLTDEQTAN